MERKHLSALGMLLAAGWSCNVLAGPVNINTADAATLAAELDGIGPALAEAIVRDRTENGKYDKPEALMRVRGIGNRVIELNKDNILVSDPASPPVPAAPTPVPAPAR
jgi:competence protein ComEA